MCQLLPLQGLNDPHLCDWLDLYETSFPWSERYLVSNHLRRLQKPSKDVFMGKMVADDGALMGIAVYLFEPELQMTYLEYMAIHPDVQGQGVGGAMLSQLIRMTDSNKYRFMVLEVEPPDGDAPNTIRRTNFYRKHGAYFVGGIEYTHHIHDGHHQPLPFDLMVIPFAAYDEQSMRAAVVDFFEGDAVLTI